MRAGVVTALENQPSHPIKKYDGGIDCLVETPEQVSTILAPIGLSPADS